MPNRQPKIDSKTNQLPEHPSGRKVKFVIYFVSIVGIFLLCCWGTGFNIPKLLRGIPHIYDLACRMLPPHISVFPNLINPTLETLQMALWGTTIPLFFALPLALLTAGNTTPNRIIAAAIRLVLNGLRTVPELIWALLLVSAVGLGPFPGVLALTLHTTGGLGKLYYEAIEATDQGIIDAIESNGSNRFKVIWFGVLPSCLPIMMSSTLWYWEYNNRASTILGLVGAGGLGLALIHAFEDFRYHEVVTCLIIIILILGVIDRISANLRKRII